MRNCCCARCARAACPSSGAASRRPRSSSAALESFAPDLILSDYTLPGFDGIEALEIAQAQRPDTPVHLRVRHHRRGACHPGAEARRRRLRAQGQPRAAGAGDRARAARGRGPRRAPLGAARARGERGALPLRHALLVHRHGAGRARRPLARRQSRALRDRRLRRDRAARRPTCNRSPIPTIGTLDADPDRATCSPERIDTYQTNKRFVRKDGRSYGRS